VNAEVTELVHHAQPSAQESACREIFGQYKPKVMVHHIANIASSKSYVFIFRQQLYFVFFNLKIIGHGNPDNNLESHCIIRH
jgi:hypothetical protein